METRSESPHLMRPPLRLAGLFGVAALVLLLADRGLSPASAAEASHARVSDQDRAQANELYESRCESCHGAEGHGDGPGAMALGKPPANFSDKKWQKRVTDKQIATVIVQGGAALGLSAEMQPNPDLASQPGVVQALVAKVRGFGK